MAEPAKATVRERRRVAAIWIIPIVALLLGVWMVVYTWSNQGPRITIGFATAEGIEAGKTKIRARSVVIGLVEQVALSDDLRSVVVTAELEKSAEALLREDTEFWVVRARVGTGGVSGIGTLLSGGYIELAPGEAAPGRRDFIGLEDIPVTPVGTPGLRLTLVSDSAGSVGPGDPVSYKGYEVGRIEQAEFDLESQRMVYQAFIRSPYEQLVNSASRFWNSSGISVSAGAEGFVLETGSLQSILRGGVAFGLPADAIVGKPVEQDERFTLFASERDVNVRPHRHSLPYVLAFDRSVRGLQPGAPVEFRGLRVGRVDEILLDEFAIAESEDRGNAIPVLIRIEPARLRMPDSAESTAELARIIARGIPRGLRATLQTGSLLTGQLYVALDSHPGQPGEAGEYAGYPTIPTASAGLENITQKVADLLDKLNALPLDDVVRSANGSLQQLQASLRSVEALLEGDEMQQLPASLTATLDELKQTLASLSADSPVHSRLSQTISDLDRALRSLDELARTLSDKPNSLIFSGEAEPDPVPPAGGP